MAAWLALWRRSKTCRCPLTLTLTLNLTLTLTLTLTMQVPPNTGTYHNLLATFVRHGSGQLGAVIRIACT